MRLAREIHADFRPEDIRLLSAPVMSDPGNN